MVIESPSDVFRNARMENRSSFSHNRTDRYWIVFALAFTVTLLVLFLILGLVIVAGNRSGWDESISLTVRDWATPQRTEIMQIFTRLGASQFAIVIVGGILLRLFWQRRFRTTVTLGAILLLAKVAESGSKTLFARPRPTVVEHLSPANGYSFPSGHTMTAVITYGLLAVVLIGMWPGRARIIPPIIAFLLIVVVGFSRIYLGVHYTTDVIGGVLLAGAFLIPATMILIRFDPRIERSSDASGVDSHRLDSHNEHKIAVPQIGSKSSST